MSILDTAIIQLRRYIDHRLALQEPFRSTVASVDGDLVYITRPGASTSDAEPAAKVTSDPLAPGDEVMVQPVLGKPVVIGLVRRASGTPLRRVGVPALWAPWLVNRYYGPKYTLGSANDVISETVTVNRTYGVPFLCPDTATVDTMAFYVSTAVAGSHAIVGIYDSGSNGFAGTLLAESAPVPIDTTGTKDVAIPATALEEGKAYWLAIVCSAAIAITSFDPAISPFPDLAYAHNPRPAAYRDGGGFVLAPPIAGFTDISPDIQLRRSA